MRFCLSPLCFLVATIALCATALFGCSDDCGAEGDTNSCVCVGALSGVQVCQSDGVWSPCVCDDDTSSTTDPGIVDANTPDSERSTPDGTDTLPSDPGNRDAGTRVVDSSEPDADASDDEPVDDSSDLIVADADATDTHTDHVIASDSHLDEVVDVGVDVGGDVDVDDGDAVRGRICYGDYLRLSHTDHPDQAIVRRSSW